MRWQLPWGQETKKVSANDTGPKKMPRALRFGANPPFQRVEETNGSYKKSTTVRNCSGLFAALQQPEVSKKQNILKMKVSLLV
ncbi:hypothetical protein [Limnohabitans sp. DM1]|uniref:hypothetical protein n=1 Tax=Limnohabitans sp. DM1 TaxID=1597955 RepID=UPI001892CAE5|nr:hypothetical protein [Limnohabitans sp. DM1]